MKKSVPRTNRLIDNMIRTIRGHKVILDRDLAALYGVPTFRFNEAVKRNRKRFPADFMFQLTTEEIAALTSQIAMSKRGRGGRRTLPYAFTEHGAVMAANILNSRRAVQMSIFVVRAFIKMRQTMATNKVLMEKLAELESKLNGIAGYRSQFQKVYGTEVTSEGVANAIGAFERTILAGSRFPFRDGRPASRSRPRDRLLRR